MTAITLIDLTTLTGAILLAAMGGEAFLRGILGAAHCLRLPKLLVATTLAAFATSSPELTVSSMAALDGLPEIGLGDALGSNVVNIALIFGLALLFGPIHATYKDLGRDFVMALLVPIMTFVLASDNLISRTEAALLLLVFSGWMLLLLRAGLLHRAASEIVADTGNAPSTKPMQALAYGVGGLMALIVAGRLFVSGATGIATALGIDAYVIGATVVAVGTSLPELVTVILARIRGHDEVGVGTLIGSNLFNGLAIVGIAASIHPIHVTVPEIAVTLASGLAALLLLIPVRAGLISRSRGILLLLLYVGFILATFAADRSTPL